MQGESSCSSFVRRLRPLHGLAAFAETINPSAKTSDELERPAMRKQPRTARKRQWEWVGLHTTILQFFSSGGGKKDASVEKCIFQAKIIIKAKKQKVN